MGDNCATDGALCPCYGKNNCHSEHKMMRYVCAECCFLIPPCAGQRGSMGGDIRLSRTWEILVRVKVGVGVGSAML